MAMRRAKKKTMKLDRKKTTKMAKLQRLKRLRILELLLNHKRNVLVLRRRVMAIR
jgi:hypothetical protein